MLSKNEESLFVDVVKERSEMESSPLFKVVLLIDIDAVVFEVLLIDIDAVDTR